MSDTEEYETVVQSNFSVHVSLYVRVCVFAQVCLGVTGIHVSICSMHVWVIVSVCSYL